MQKTLHIPHCLSLPPFCFCHPPIYLSRQPARREAPKQTHIGLCGGGKCSTTAWVGGRSGWFPSSKCYSPPSPPFSLLLAWAEPRSLHHRTQFSSHTLSLSDSLGESLPHYLLQHPCYFPHPFGLLLAEIAFVPASHRRSPLELQSTY